MASQQDDSRFAHLLQPIRDLAANWDIDVAKELEEYLETLEDLTFAFDGGPTLNFAEAALLIQGTACIYSRKVEHLHALVYQALDQVSDRRKKDKAPAADRAGVASEDDDSTETFLALDDLPLAEGHNIDLREDLDAAVAAAPPRPALAHLAFDDAGPTQSSEHQCQMTRSVVHESGALLLDPQDLYRLDRGLYNQEASCSHGPSRQGSQGPQNHQQAGGGGSAPGAADLPGPAEAAGPADAAEPADPGGMPQDWPDDEDGYGDLHLQGMDDCAPSGPLGDPAGQSHELPGRHAGGSTRPGTTQPEQEEAPQAPEYDPYEPLDPHDAGPYPLAPFRRLKRRPKRWKADKPAVTFLDNLWRLGTGLNCPEFAYALPDKLKQKAASTHGRPRETSESVPSRGVFTAEDAAASQQAVPGFCEDDEHLGPQGPADLIPEPDDGGFSSGGEDGGWNGGPDQGSWDEAARPDLQLAKVDAEMSYEEVCRAHVESLVAAAAAAAHQTALSTRVASWQAKIGPLLEVQEQRAEFDLHATGEDIVHRMASATLAGSPTCQEQREVGFDAVGLSSTPWEVARSFAAMLQLANSRKIEICRHTDLQPGVGSMAGDPSVGFCLSLLAAAPAPMLQIEGCGEYIENEDTNAQASQLPLEPGPKKKKTTKGVKRSKVAA